MSMGCCQGSHTALKPTRTVPTFPIGRWDWVVLTTLILDLDRSMAATELKIDGPADLYPRHSLSVKLEMFCSFPTVESSGMTLG